MILTRERKLAITIGLFVLGVLMVALAAATETVAPLFVAWIPLAGVAWVLTRPEPGMAARIHDADEETELNDEDADELDANEEPTELLPGDTRTDAEADGEDVDAD